MAKTKKRTPTKTPRARRPKIDGFAFAKALRNARIKRGRGWVGIRFF